jgi:hypothetical protein
MDGRAAMRGVLVYQAHGLAVLDIFHMIVELVTWTHMIHDTG